MNCTSTIYREHAVLRMVARRITRPDVAFVLKTGRIIAQYPSDKPFPSCLVLGYVANQPLHVVVATDANEACIVITAYWPDPALWSDDFTQKKL